MEWFRPVGEKLLEMASLEDGFLVLDIATGSGEPGLSAAKRIGKGRVIGVDSSEDMLAIAREKAQNLGMRNYETRLLESAALPFPADHFDAVTCRFGVMFFPDLLDGVKEMARVLKPNRRLVVSVWGPQDKRREAFAQILLKIFDLPTPAPDSPDPYRLSRRGRITSLLRDSRLVGVEEREVRGTLRIASPELYWQYVKETSPSIAFAIRSISQEELKKKESEILAALASIAGKNGEISFDWVAWVDAGTKPGI